MCFPAKCSLKVRCFSQGQQSEAQHAQSRRTMMESKSNQPLLSELLGRLKETRHATKNITTALMRTTKKGKEWKIASPRYIGCLLVIRIFLFLRASASSRMFAVS